ncbi:hypothetical protein BJ986_000457 [Phycicoccus badiiscoriae]|uniref:Uncharacterized protein n=1 Tax=Pedococcus badiiscoriae TaxID=642776 RepID=A0A852WBE6_9MICO|nr:hypothetical protein [Pedococcus badiiscoriae]
MLPTYWPTDAPPILRQNNAETSDVWLAHSQVSDAAALWAIAVRAIHDSERRPGEPLPGMSATRVGCRMAG